MVSAVNYEVLSRDAVQQMHQKFMGSVEEKAKKALPENAKDAGALVESMVALLVACARKAVDIKADELTDIARRGKRAIENRTIEVRKSPHAKVIWADNTSADFSKSQERRQAQAKQKRQEDPEVLKVFGDEERIYLRMKSDDGGPMSDARAAIAKHLAPKGYRIIDYRKGYATDESGKQQFRIGKLLKDDVRLYKDFMDDSTRTLDSLLVVISRNADDIARMSTGRAWTSCMGSEGENYRYVPRDIRKGTLIAYMVSDKDPEILNPLARILIKPFHKEAGKLTTIARAVFGRKPEQIFIPEQAYGLDNDAFSQVVKQFVEEKFNHGREGVYTTALGLYQQRGMAKRHVRHNEATFPVMFSFNN
jgi:hypothetical protein